MSARRLCVIVGGCGAALAAWLGCGGSTGAGDIIGAGDAGEGGASSGTSGTSGASGSSGTSGSPDGGVDPAGAGPGGSTTTLPCGATTCAIPAQTCCVAMTGGGTSYACAGADAGCVGVGGGGGGGGGGDTTALKCSGAANCGPGTVCCVHATNNGVASDCQATCGMNEAQLCDKSAATTGCPAMQACSSQNIGDWGLSAPYATCGGKGN